MRKSLTKVELKVILNMFQHKGFFLKWISWFAQILCSGTSLYYLLMGCTLHKRGVIRQGRSSPHITGSRPGSDHHQQGSCTTRFDQASFIWAPGQFVGDYPI